MKNTGSWLWLVLLVLDQPVLLFHSKHNHNSVFLVLFKGNVEYGWWAEDLGDSFLELPGDSCQLVFSSSRLYEVCVVEGFIFALSFTRT